MSLRHLRPSAGIMPGLSGATRVGRAVLVPLAFLFMVGQPVGAVRSEWDVGTPGKPEASGNGPGNGELPLESTATSDITGPSEPTGPQEAGIEEPPAEPEEETRGPEGSLEARTLEQPIRPYPGPEGTPEGPAEEIAEAPLQQPTPEAPKKRRGPFFKLPQWAPKAKTGLRKAWDAFRARLRRAKEIAQRGVAKVMVRLPKWRRRRPAKAEAPLYPLTEREMELLKIAPECETVVGRLSLRQRMSWRLHPRLCFLWSLFNRDGMLSANKEKMLDLSRELSNYLDAESSLDPKAQDLEAVNLRLQRRVAMHENNIARLAEEVDKSCWFTNPQKIYERADKWERRLLAAYSSFLSIANPCEMLKEVPHLLKLARQDGDSCWANAQQEKSERRILIRSLGAAQSQTSQLEVSNGDKEAAAAFVRDLELLQKREACSLETLFIMQEVETNTMEWIGLHRQTSSLARRRMSYIKAMEQCKWPSRNASIIPWNLKRPCNEFLSSRRPRTSDEAALRMAWFWEAAHVRLPKEE